MAKLCEEERVEHNRGASSIHSVLGEREIMCGESVREGNTAAFDSQILIAK